MVLLELELVPRVARARSPKFAVGCCQPRRAARHHCHLRVRPSAIDRSFASQASLRCKSRHKPFLLALDRVGSPKSSARCRSPPQSRRRRPAAASWARVRVLDRPIAIRRLGLALTRVRAGQTRAATPTSHRDRRILIHQIRFARLGSNPPPPGQTRLDPVVL
jgi:hypothetical protein